MTFYHYFVFLFSGKHFCTGGDPKEFLGKSGGSGSERHFADLLAELSGLPQCLIGVIQG